VRLRLYTWPFCLKKIASHLTSNLDGIGAGHQDQSPVGSAVATLELLTAQLAANDLQRATDFRMVKDEMTSLIQRTLKLEEGGRDEQGPRSKRSLIHMKMITPTVLSQTEHWKKWKSDEEVDEDWLSRLLVSKV
jgi:hypothetical protein